MLLALDVGNTNITVGLFDGERLARNWRLRTVHEQTADEWGILFRNLFDLAGLSEAVVDGIIVSSVVPSIDANLRAMGQRYFGCAPLFIGPEVDIGIENRYDSPREVGADRLVNAVAMHHRYGGPGAVVDLGTSINFDIVSADGAFLGGMIAPGIGMAIAGLFTKTARLPMVDFREPAKLIGSNTVGSIQSGLYYGTIGMIDGILERLREVLGPEMKAVATGGQASLIARGSKYLKIVDEDLTLQGLRLIWERNRRP